MKSALCMGRRYSNGGLNHMQLIIADGNTNSDGVVDIGADSASATTSPFGLPSVTFTVKTTFHPKDDVVEYGYLVISRGNIVL